jgi:hypothetical protein
VVGVGKDDLRPCGAHFFWKKGLDGGLGPDRHERRSLDDSVAGGHSSPAGAAGAIDRQHLEPKWTRHPIVGRSGAAGRASECGSEYGQLIERGGQRYEKMTKLRSRGVPQRIGGCGSAAPHAVDGIVPGRPVSRRRAVLDG